MSPHLPVVPPRVSRAPDRRRAWLSAAAVCLSLSLAAQGPSHVLQKGETLYAVSKKYDISLEALLLANEIEDPDKVKSGRTLSIPSTHKVKKGETLYGISKAYGVGVEEIRSLNKLGVRDFIKPGDTLLIPDASSTAPAVGAAGSASGAVDGGKEAGKGPVSGSGGAPAHQAEAQDTAAAIAAAPRPIPAVPEPVRVSTRPVDPAIVWPCSGEIAYLEGKLEGVMIKARAGEAAKAVASGTVVSAGLFRGYSQVAIVQSRTGQLYVYGGNDTLSVAMGDKVKPGQELGRIGPDAKLGGHVAYFFVYKKSGEAVDPAVAARD